MRRTLLALLAVAVLAVAPAALAAARPSGKYQKTLSSAAGELGGSTYTVDFAAGKVKLTLTRGGNVLSSYGGSYRYSISGDKLTLKAAGEDCGTGKYKFTLTGDKLSFKVISDSCGTRPTFLGSKTGTFTKVT
jgi:hypothetical protein